MTKRDFVRSSPEINLIRRSPLFLIPQAGGEHNSGIRPGSRAACAVCVIGYGFSDKKPGNVPDPKGLATAREIQVKVRPAEVILGRSRAVGAHRPDSDVDLIAVAPDNATAGWTKEILRELPEGKLPCQW